MYKIYKKHEDLLPFVRIKRLELTNFKGVKHGELEFNCAKETIPYNTKSDILGLYGQNGSGKSSMVEALDILKLIVGGYRLPDGFVRYIDASSDFSRLEIELDFQYLSGEVATVSYEVELTRGVKKDIPLEGEGELESHPCKQYLRISNEIVKTNIYEDGRIGRIHSIVDTKNKDFCKETLEEYYYKKSDNSVKQEILYLKRKCNEDSKSLVFSDELSELLNIVNTEESSSKYYEVLAEMNYYFTRFLHVIGTRSSGFVQLRAGIPIYIPGRRMPLLLNEKSKFSLKMFEHVTKFFKQINIVLDVLIPGLQLELKGFPSTMENGEEGMTVEIQSRRGEKVFPFEYESDGIIKIVSILTDYICAFNQGSTTLVIDEFDSGIFEFLLGELLQIFESSGKGQFIFTSHNLRPLEVIDKKFIRFTTSNPDNRYYKLKNVGSTNNLRDLYLREVQLGKMDVEMYKRTKSFKIVQALKEAGEEYTTDGKE